LKVFTEAAHPQAWYLNRTFSLRFPQKLVINEPSGKSISDIIFCMEGTTLRGSDPYL
jgi:hypothetical protein